MQNVVFTQSQIPHALVENDSFLQCYFISINGHIFQFAQKDALFVLVQNKDVAIFLVPHKILAVSQICSFIVHLLPASRKFFRPSST